MDCRMVIRMLQDEIDGRLPPSEAESVRRHVDSCASCAAEAEAHRRTGEILRAWAAARGAEKETQLAALWTRIRAGIEERRVEEPSALRARRWLWLPAALLAVFALLFYPSDVRRAPFRPTSFEVAVEHLESDAAMVALVDKGDDLPRVIWIIEDDET